MENLTRYFKDTAAELKHVKWPSSSQAIVYTALVIAISAAVALILAGFDYLFTNLLQMVV